jgi:phosphopantetheinyl transferase
MLPRAGLSGMDLQRVADEVLSRDERLLWQALSGEARQSEWMAGRLAAKLAIRQTLAHPVASWPLAQIEVLRDAQGAPASRLGGVDGPSVSISHTARFAVAAVSPLGHIGVDVEEIHSLDPDAVHHMLTDGEQLLAPSFLGGGRRAVTAMWTIKEAGLKALGVGLERPPTSVEVAIGPGLRVSVEAALVPDSHVAQAWVARFDDHMMALVVLTRSPARAPATVA